MGDIVYLTTKQKMVEDIDTTNLGPFKDTYKINGVEVPAPKTAKEYQALCKMFLTTDDYEGIMMGIMDEEYYNLLEPELQKIVYCYYTFPN